MSDPNTPSWLTAEVQAPVEDVNVDSAPVTASTSTAPNIEPSSSNDEEATELPQIILLMRLANMAAAAGLMTLSIFTMISDVFKISLFILALYATCGGLLICCLETQLKFLRVIIAVNFGFLFNSTFRFVFYLILASICWSYDSFGGQIVAIALAAVALFNTYVLCRYPQYRKVREKIAEEEDKRVEARISKEVRAQAARSITGK